MKHGDHKGKMPRMPAKMPKMSWADMPMMKDHMREMPSRGKKRK